MAWAWGPVGAQGLVSPSCTSEIGQAVFKDASALPSLVWPRVNRMHISPNNRNAIHPGDRILEINGAPVRTLRVEEVPAVCPVGSGGRTVNRPSLSCH